MTLCSLKGKCVYLCSRKYLIRSIKGKYRYEQLPSRVMNGKDNAFMYDWISKRVFTVI